MGDAGGARRRCRARRSRGAGAGRRRPGDGSIGRRARSPRARRRAHRRSGSDDRRDDRRHGRRRSGEHRVTHPVRRPTGHGLRRRVDPARERRGDHVRGRGVACAERQSRAGDAIARGTGHRRHRRELQADRPRASLRRARPRVTAGQRLVPRFDRGQEGAPRFSDRHRRHREVAARLGVLQVHRRSGGPGLLASGPLPLIRGGRQLLGARRDGAHARADRGRRRPSDRRVEVACCGRAVRGRRRRAQVDRAALGSSARTGRARRARLRGPLRGMACLLRAASGAEPRHHGVRRHAVGRRRTHRVHRISDELVAQLSNLRHDVGPSRVPRAASGLGRGQARIHVAVLGAPIARCDGRDA